MIEQPVPEVTEEDAKRIVLRDFGDAQAVRGLSILAQYENSPRVRLAILKLASGDIAKLNEITKVAVEDYRDVLARAEYPRYMREVGFDDIPLFTRQGGITDEDRRPYREWFERT